MSFKNKKIRSLLALLMGAIFVGYWFTGNLTTLQEADQSPITKRQTEIVQKILKSNNINEQKLWYIKLIELIGPEEAQEVLHNSGIPFTGQAHLLNHTAGDYIWAKFGPEGLSKCRDYFSSSCYHGFILNALGNGNFDNLKPMLAKCKTVGSSAYGQCMHAIGHGFLPYVGYANVPKALTLCDETNRKIPDFRKDYCYNGVFMENVWGLHEGKPSDDRWVDPNNIMYPCDDPEFDREHTPECWYNQAQYLIQVFKGDLVRVGSVCVGLLYENDKEKCFDGLFRSMHSITQNDLQRKFAICQQMPSDWKDTCIGLQAASSFQQGDQEFPYTICQVTEFGTEKCYEELAAIIDHYYHDSPSKSFFCNKIPQEYRTSSCL